MRRYGTRGWFSPIWVLLAVIAGLALFEAGGLSTVAMVGGALALVLKVAILFAIVGWAVKRFGAQPHQHGPVPGSESGESQAARFEEWHQMAHAREEVDGWVADDDETE